MGDSSLGGQEVLGDVWVEAASFVRTGARKLWTITEGGGTGVCVSVYGLVEGTASLAF
jgi:hypothetical protein